jgi:hypothetical protein
MEEERENRSSNLLSLILRNLSIIVAHRHHHCVHRAALSRAQFSAKHGDELSSQASQLPWVWLWSCRRRRKKRELGERKERKKKDVELVLSCRLARERKKKEKKKRKGK